MTDALYDTRHDRTVNLIAEGNRGRLAMEFGRSPPNVRMIAVLDDLIALHGTPKTLRLGGGSDFIAIAHDR